MPSTLPSMVITLAGGAAEPPTARRLDRDHVAGLERGRHLGRDLGAAQAVPAGHARPTAPFALRRVPAPLRDDREPAGLEHAQLADDSVATAMPPTAPRTDSQAVALDAKRVLQLE